MADSPGTKSLKEGIIQPRTNYRFVQNFMIPNALNFVMDLQLIIIYLQLCLWHLLQIIYAC